MNEDAFKRIKELHLPDGKYLLSGSLPLGIRNLRKCRDIDIIVAEDIWDGYKKMGWEIKEISCGTKYLQKDDIELWKDWVLDYDTNIIEEAEIIDNLPFMSLKRTVEWKNITKRKKDLEDIKIIEQYYREQ